MAVLAGEPGNRVPGAAAGVQADLIVTGDKAMRAGINPWHLHHLGRRLPGTLAAQGLPGTTRHPPPAGP